MDKRTMDKGTMEKWKKVLRPSPLPAFLIVTSAALLLTLTLNGTVRLPAVLYASYLYSSYALAVACAFLPGAVRWIRKRAEGWMKLWAASSARFDRVYEAVREPERRTRTLLVPSLVFNLVYAAFKLGLGYFLSSWWMGAAGIYYAVLAGLRFSLLRTFQKRKKEAGGAAERTGGRQVPETGERRQRNDPASTGERDWKTYRNTAIWLFLLTLTMTGIITQTVIEGRAYHYPGFLVYAFALYAFVKMGTAVTSLIRKRHEENLLLAASRCLSFACALMSMLALQTALISQFGGEEDFARTANSLFGFFMCLAMLGICGHMFYRYDRHRHPEKRRVAGTGRKRSRRQSRKPKRGKGGRR